LKCFEAASEAIGLDEVVQVEVELLVAVIMAAFDGSFFKGAVHPLDLSICPGVFGLREPVLNGQFAASPLEEMYSGVFVLLPVGELDAVVTQHGMDDERSGFLEVA
jgi:hypothetical protein